MGSKSNEEMTRDDLMHEYIQEVSLTLTINKLLSLYVIRSHLTYNQLKNVNSCCRELQYKHIN